MRVPNGRVWPRLVLTLGLAMLGASVSGQRTAKESEAEAGNPDAYLLEVPGFDGGALQASGNLRSGAILASQAIGNEVEPNGNPATASPLGGTNGVVRGYIYPSGDADYYSFTAAAGNRIYAATMTSTSASANVDSLLTLIGPDGGTVIEIDNDNGTFGPTSASIAGAVLPAAGTYFLRVDGTPGNTVRPYELHFRLQGGAPTPEVETNDTPVAANPLPGSGWVSGTRNPAALGEQDYYSLALNAGDSVFLSLDLDPERDSVTWNGRVGFGMFGDAGNQLLVADDLGAVEGVNPTIPSEAMFFTVRLAGTYFVSVDSAAAATGGPTATYQLSVSVHPATDEGLNCTTYTSVDVPKSIGPSPGLVSSTITVPGNPRIADLDVDVVLGHTFMNDIDAHLRSPAGNDNGLFTDIGNATVGGSQTQMVTTFDDEAAAPPLFTALKGAQVKPELNYRLSWFDGEDAGGTWTLDLRDDATGDAGALTSWSIRICEAPPPPTCPVGHGPITVFSTNFEGGAAGFVASGGSEWELGLPATAATTTSPPVAGFTNCNSGVNCWKTDLDSTYNPSTSHDLLSPIINLSGRVAPVVVSWAQRYQLESANFDHMFVDYQQSGGATPVRLFEWLDATMTNQPGNPVTNIGASAGWAQLSRRADSLAGLSTELRFHLDADTTVNLGGLAIDDVSVTVCTPQVKATMTGPTPGTTLLGTTFNFAWSAGAGADMYWLFVGTTGVGTFDIFNQNQGTATTSGPVTGFPAAGGTVFVRLLTHFETGWQFNDYTYFRYTDDPLFATVTAVKAAHIVQLRQRVAIRRLHVGLPPFSWTDLALAPGTNVRAVHITELRTALAEAYLAGGITPLPAYTDPVLAAGTPIRAVHITQLRSAILAIE